MTQTPNSPADLVSDVSPVSADVQPLFDTVLVANRGEIAVRIIRTLRRLGIRSVAIHSDADAEALHVREADHAERVGPAPAAQSYLDIDAVIEACRRSGAQAVHPGYGFLSENVDFARALDQAGITFIGPSVDSLHAMGDKIRSKQHVTAHGVPVVPGIAEPGLSDQQLLDAAQDVGFPLLIKPSAGGGGKGMFAVESAEQLPEALASARRTARSAFGDDTLFLERLVRRPRHIEVQVLADSQGHAVHLAERECSLQRRHQKVIEEAPAPLFENLPDGPELRERMGQAAVDAARSVQYLGAGTVEFLVSDENPQEFFFMEMNTRLQVEHPVTEEVIRWNGDPLDLVEWQVRIAAGQALPFASADLTLEGHAIEARVYAEDPAQGFLPAVGDVADVVLPSGPGVRVDSSLDGPGEVSSHYDPMIAKVITHGADRAEALARLDQALAHTAVLGLTTNIPYLRELIADPDVSAGRLHTTFLDERDPFITPQPTGPALQSAARSLGGAVQDAAPDDGHAPAQARLGSASGHLSAVWRLDGWRATGRVSAERWLEIDGEAVQVPDEGAPGDQDAQDGAGTAAEPEVRLGTVDGRPAAHVSHGGHSFTATALTRQDRVRRALGTAGGGAGPGGPEATSPMPGTVVSLAVADGDTVTAGQTLVGVEAMKMEYPVTASVDGTVSVHVSVGEQVSKGQVLATVQPADGSV
ncbi:biotin carboxylase N-terminal domain-containing protein [Micrococcus terreus]|uniref:acetyl/propionyl/methylcrotonyl-CoA carboxylase subunit alpha n=1 Tax=Micrococcus terreus TaxID=574650 RepID=UPI003F4CB533